MFLEEAAAKSLLAGAGVRVPAGRLAATPEEAREAASAIGRPVAVKAQVAAGKRGRSGGVRFADGPAEAEAAAAALLGGTVSGLPVRTVLVEERVPVLQELYAAIVTDAGRKRPVLLFSTEGGTDIEETFAASPERVVVHPLDVRRPLEPARAAAAVSSLGLGGTAAQVVPVLAVLYDLYRSRDAELVEVNPLAMVEGGGLVALDGKIVVDDSALSRQAGLPAPAPTGTPLEREALARGLLYVELDGDVGILANGAGLTMATMDAVAYYGGRPANFLEIGGQAYRRATEALGLVLGNPRVRSLLVNLCGAYARTDVIIEGVLAGWEALRPRIPVAFSIHGTGEARAVELVRTRLGVEPYDRMDDAVLAAVRYAAGAAAEVR